MARGLKDELFRRLTGIKKQTFKKMIGILEEAHFKKKRGLEKYPLYRGHAINELRISERISSLFSYQPKLWCEESRAYKTVRWVEDTLVKHPDFCFPGRALLRNDVAYEVILVDATEPPIERPKKTKVFLLGQKEEAYPQNSDSC